MENLPMDLVDKVLSYNTSSDFNPLDKPMRERHLKRKEKRDFQRFQEMIPIIEQSLTKDGLEMDFPRHWITSFHRGRLYLTQLEMEGNDTLSLNTIYRLCMTIIVAEKQRHYYNDEFESLQRIHDIILLCMFVRPQAFRLFTAGVSEDETFHRQKRDQFENVVTVYDETENFLQESDNISVAIGMPAFYMKPIIMVDAPDDAHLKFTDGIDSRTQFSYILLLNEIHQWLQKNETTMPSAFIVRMLLIHKEYSTYMFHDHWQGDGYPLHYNHVDPHSGSIFYKFTRRLEKILCDADSVDSRSLVLRNRIITILNVFRRNVVITMASCTERGPAEVRRVLRLQQALVKRVNKSVQLGMRKVHFINRI
jgi:hypothetical protein